TAMAPQGVAARSGAPRQAPAAAAADVVFMMASRCRPPAATLACILRAARSIDKFFIWIKSI
ncbi:hypothetical protein, partial [Bordetella pertussis]